MFYFCRHNILILLGMLFKYLLAILLFSCCLTSFLKIIYTIIRDFNSLKYNNIKVLILSKVIKLHRLVFLHFSKNTYEDYHHSKARL